MKRTLLSVLLLLSSGSVFAQSPGRFMVKLSDGTTHDLNRAGAFIREDRSLVIFANTKGNISNNYQLRIKPTSEEIRRFSKGRYLFNLSSRRLEYTPGGPSTDYETDAYYSQKSNENITQEWMSASSPEFGYIEIESITADRVKGKFYCEVIQRLPVKGAKKIMEGTFDLAIIKAGTNSQNTAPASNPNTSSTSQSAGSESKAPDKNPVFGFYDMQFALAAITSGDMGIDVDLGTTLVNLSYAKDNDASATVELHYDYSRQKFSNMQFRRNHVYARIRPFTSAPNSETSLEYILAMLIGGVYADLGYSTGHYFYTDNMGERQAPDYNTNGLFWGMGWNLIWRRENRWGANVGFGSKRYTLSLPDGTDSKYRTRLITLGVVRNFLWKN